MSESSKLDLDNVNKNKINDYSDVSGKFNLSSTTNNSFHNYSKVKSPDIDCPSIKENIYNNFGNKVDHPCDGV